MSDSARSPLSGCAILIAAVCTLLFLIGFSMWVPFRQAAAIEKFTRADPAPVPAAELSETEGRELDARLASFREAVEGGEQAASLELDVNDLNDAIARYPQFKELRGTFHVKEIRDDEMLIDICYQLNGRPRLAKEGEDGPIAADPRYLVGTMHVTPLLSKREVALHVKALDVPGAEVDEGFMGHFSTLRILERYLKDPAIGPVMARLTQARLQDGKLLLARNPGEPVPDVVTDQQFRKGGSRIVIFIGGALLVFLLLAGTLLFLGYRAQLKKIQEEERTNAPSTDV
ncbi:hypothetical protein [Haloferula sargassicola]|uniref:Uncharacterized protein n=1 Tax=Haloferula sargassicola TaxID=490096 RepID=A0ABP9UKN3_9BACT